MIAQCEKIGKLHENVAILRYSSPSERHIYVFLSMADKNWTRDLAMEEKNVGQCKHGFSWK